jgi:hypothetical protein
MRMSLNIKNKKKEDKLQNCCDIVETSNIIHLLFITLSPPQSLLKYLQITYMKFPE